MRSRPRHIAALLGTSTCAVFVSVATAPAARAASLLLGPGTYTANTATLHLTGPSTDVTGKNVGGIAVFRFSTVNVPDGATILATGSRPFELAATNSLIVGGIIDGSGATATRGQGAAPPGPGGGAGGERTSFTSSTPGSGPGGGAAGSNGENGGAGGGFGGAGARGAVCLDPGCTGGTAATGGARYGNPDTTLQGGSGGGPGWTDALGGGGGGAIALVGASVTITTTAVVIANGGDGDSGGSGASGGGSGGAIVVHGQSVQLDGELRAEGGVGGKGACCGDGGGGGGGRIAIQFRSFSTRDGSLNLRVFGGVSGGRSTSGFPSGGPSPDPAGANGVITFTHIDPSVLSIGPSRTIDRGSTVTIATRLTDRATAKPIAHQPVALYRRSSPSGPWTKFATRTTSATGRASVPVSPTRPTTYQWRYSGSWVHDPTTSAKQSVTFG